MNIDCYRVAHKRVESIECYRIQNWQSSSSLRLAQGGGQRLFVGSSSVYLTLQVLVWMESCLAGGLQLAGGPGIVGTPVVSEWMTARSSEVM